MASFLSLGLSSYKPAAFRPQASTGSRKVDPNNGRSNWWTPLFGWPADGTGYITDGGEVKTNHKFNNNAQMTEQRMSAARFRPGCFTEEKARRMRRKTAEGETFQDVMYHSAIASRLALGGGGEEEEN